MKFKKKERIGLDVRHEKMAQNQPTLMSALMEGGCRGEQSAAHGLGLNAGSMDGARACECVCMAGVTGELAPEGRACICSLTLVKHASHTRTDWLKPRCSRGMRCDEQREQYRRPVQTAQENQRGSESEDQQGERLQGRGPAAAPACRGTHMFLCTDRILCSDAFARAR